ncbi:MAG: hypothetical protein WCS59_00560 [Sphaerochaetaceae bacterium]|jgi:hypothetical protein|nr:hypothetical protein [Sphaerochaetaceae bacterium]
MAKRKCPKCGSTNTVRILYGFPAPEAVSLAEQGKVILGGCCVTLTDPEFHCKDCEHEWRKHAAV